MVKFRIFSKVVKLYLIMKLLSLKVIKGHRRSKIKEKGQNGRHLIFRKSEEIKRQNEAFYVRF